MRKTRRRVGAAVALILLASVAIILTGGEYPLFLAAITIPGILAGVRAFRHPERVPRVYGGEETTSIIANDGLALTAFGASPSPFEARLAVIDALDNLRGDGRAQRLSLAGRLAASLGAVAWLVGAGYAWSVERDLAGVLVCSAAGGLFAALSWYISRQTRRERAAFDILEGQLKRIEATTHGALGPGGLTGGAV